jgi:hypothetical protein
VVLLKIVITMPHSQKHGSLKIPIKASHWWVHGCSKIQVTAAHWTIRIPLAWISSKIMRTHVTNLLHIALILHLCSQLPTTFAGWSHGQYNQCIFPSKCWLFYPSSPIINKNTWTIKKKREFHLNVINHHLDPIKNNHFLL